MSNCCPSVRQCGEVATESTEQIVGFYLVESDGEAELRAACERFAARGELIELRRLAE